MIFWKTCTHASILARQADIHEVPHWMISGAVGDTLRQRVTSVNNKLLGVMMHGLKN